jgi:hypothetical protein
VGFKIFAQDREMFWRHGGIAFPPNRVFGLSVANDEFIGCRTSCMFTCLYDQRSALCDFRAFISDGGFIKASRRPVPIDEIVSGKTG